MNRRSFIGRLTAALAAIPFFKRRETLHAEMNATVLTPDEAIDRIVPDPITFTFHSPNKPDPREIFAIVGRCNAEPWRGFAPHTVMLSGCNWAPGAGTTYKFRPLYIAETGAGHWDGWIWLVPNRELYGTADFNLYDFGEQVA